MKQFLHFSLSIVLITLLGCTKSELTSENENILPQRQIEILSNGDELITLKSGISVVKRGEKYIYQGDIVLTPEQVDILESDTKVAYTSNLSRRWSNQIVYYTIEDSRVEMIKSALSHIEKIFGKWFDFIENNVEIRFNVVPFLVW